MLSTLLGDFEWEDTASLANYVALMVTPFLRRPLRALVPLAIVSASAPASGKSLLSALIGLLVGQQTVPWPADNDTELEKLITSTFTVESGAVIFDNLARGGGDRLPDPGQPAHQPDVVFPHPRQIRYGRVG